MEIQARKRQRSLNIDYNNVDDKLIVNPMKVLNENDETFKAIWSNRVWEKGQFNEPSIELLDEDERKLLPPNDLFNVSSSLSDRQLISQSLVKSIYEFDQLQHLSTLLLQQTSVVLHDVRKDLHSIGIPLPSQQLINIYQNIFKSTKSIISKGIPDAKAVISQRQLYNNAILKLRKHWRLVQLPTKHVLRYHSYCYSYQSSSLLLCRTLQSEGIVGSNADIIAADCSYGCCGDRTTDTHLVALLIGLNGPYLPKLEKDKPVNTICFSLRQRTQKSIEIASATAWDTCQHALEQIAGPYITSDLIDIHKHLERRQHDAFCQTLFNLLKSEVVTEHNNWLIPLNVTSTTNRSADKSLIHACIEKFFGERLVQTIEVTSVEQGRIIVSISDSIELVIKLVDLEDIEDNDTTNNNTNNNDNDNDGIAILRSCFTKTLKHCLLLSQSLLLKHFKDTGSIINRHSLVPKENIYYTSSSSSNKGDRKKSVIYNLLYVMIILLERYRTDTTLSKLAAIISDRGQGDMTFNITIRSGDATVASDASSSLHHEGYNYNISHPKFTAWLSIDDKGLRVVSIIPTITFSITTTRSIDSNSSNIDSTCNYSIATSTELESFFENVVIGCDVRDMLLNFELYSIEPSVYISVHPIGSTCFDIRSSSSSIEGYITVIRITVSAKENVLVLQVIDDNLSEKMLSLCSSSLISRNDTTGNLFKLPIDEQSSTTIKLIAQQLL